MVGMVADPPALRMRRSRLHRRGDHSLCKSCDAQEVLVGSVTIPPGKVADSVTDFVARLSFGEDDPRGPMCVIAVAAAESLDVSFSPGVARELSSVLSNISEDPNHPPDLIDELRLRKHVRRLRTVLDHMSDPRPQA
jgi:hypothetical protein